MPTVANNIETLRKMQNLSVQDVCEDLRMEPSEYRTYSQCSNLTAETAAKFADYFVCTVNQLISKEPLNEIESRMSLPRISILKELEHIRNEKALWDILDLVCDIRGLVEAEQY